MGDIFLRTYDDRRLAMFVAAKYREYDDILAQLVITTLSILGSQVESNFFFRFVGFLYIFCQLIERGFQLLKIFRTVTLREFLHRIDIRHLPVLITPGKFPGGHVIGPDMHLTGLEDQGQTAVTLIIQTCKTIALQTVADEIDQHDEQQDAGSGNGI